MKRYLILLILSIICAFACTFRTQEISLDEVKEIQLNKNSVELLSGESITICAMISPSEIADIYIVNWSSSDKDIAIIETISANSVIVTAIAEGSCRITAECDGKTASCMVKVTKADIPVSDLILDKADLVMVEGEEYQLQATITPEDATNKEVRWMSENENVATVTEGLVKAVAAGSTTITATCGEITAKCAVTIKNKHIEVKYVSLDKTKAGLLVGETLQLTATVFPDNATDKTVTWTSSDSNVATVENGLVTALSAGEAVISATAEEKSANCSVAVTVPFSYGGMCLEAVSGGMISIYNQNGLTIEYKVENNEWTPYIDSGRSIMVKAGERVWFRGNNETYTTGNSDDGFKTTHISCGFGDFYLYGNLMSLIYGDDYEEKTVITGDHAFFKLFTDNANIINHPTLDIELPATTLSPSCYSCMFYKCTKLTRAPKLPAKVLTESCYSTMFAYCTSLKEFPEMNATDMAYMCCCWMMEATGIEEAPELPAMNLANSCYEFMFSECKNLRRAMSILPATTLAPGCYFGMFQHAEKLEHAPELPATELASGCYGFMFNGCTALKIAPELPATSLASSCYSHMFSNTALTKAPELPVMNLEASCYGSMFENCTELEQAPVLPALQLTTHCYDRMFYNCTKLNFIKAMFLNKTYNYCTSKWVEGVEKEGTFVKNSEATWDDTGINGIPEGWTVQYE